MIILEQIFVYLLKSELLFKSIIQSQFVSQNSCANMAKTFSDFLLILINAFLCAIFLGNLNFGAK